MDVSIQQEKMDNYIVNPETGRRLFVNNDQVLCTPGHLDLGGETSTVGYSYPARSFIFHSLPIQNVSLKDGSRITVVGDPTEASWQSEEVAQPEASNNLGFDRSFVDLMNGYFSADSSNFSDFEFFSSDITDSHSDHVFLNVPGKEYNIDRDPEIKRRVASTPGEKFYPFWHQFQNYEGEQTSESGTTSLRDLLVNSSRKYNRRFEDIINGVKAHSEIIYFRIAKYDENGKFIQNIFVPNAPEFNPKYFVETQLLPDKNYSYTIYAWLAIYGNTYSYELAAPLQESLLDYYNNAFDYEGNQTVESYGFDDWASGVSDTLGTDFLYTFLGYREYGGSSDDDDNKKHAALRSSVTVNTAPCIKCVEIPYYKMGGFVQNLSIVSPHPVKPNVEIVPYEGKNDTLLFLLSSRHGSSHKDFLIGINPEDDEQILLAIEKMISDGVKSFSEKGLQYDFETVSEIDRFEAYRLEEKPSTYLDFSEGTRVDLKPLSGTRKEPGPTNANNNTVKSFSISSVSYKDETITPNKKYYYTFRTVDKNGKFSNPTPVYEIEIIDDKGTIYPVIDIVDFDIENNLQATKNMRKYMFIAPTLEQTELNFSEAEGIEATAATAGTFLKTNTSQPKLGVSEKVIFQEKYKDGVLQGEPAREYFKVRLTSKKTGKKADINLRFRINHKSTQEQEKSEEAGTPV